MTDERRAELTERLSLLKGRLNDLKRADYVAPVTQDVEGDDRFGSSEEFDFADAYNEPEEAIKAHVETLLIEQELSTGKRVRIIREDEVQKIFERNNGNRTFKLLKNGLISRKEIVPVEKKIAFAVSTDTSFVNL